MLNISESVRILRQENHYTQETLAELCGVSRQAVAKWEAGTNLPDIEKLMRLSDIFHTSVDALLTGNRTASEEKSPEQLSDHAAQNEKIVNQALQKALVCKDPDDEINAFISAVGSSIGCDRMYIFEQSQTGSYKNTYEWCGRGVAPQIEFLQNIPLEDMSIWLNTFSKNEYVFLEDVDAIADTEPAVYRWLKPQDIRSILVLPLFGGRCFLGADNPAAAFIGQTSSLMGIMIHFVETMLERRDLENRLELADFQISQINRIGNIVRYQLNIVTGQFTYDHTEAEKLGYPLKIDNFEQLKAMIEGHPEFRDHLMIDGIERAVHSGENLSIEFLSYRKDRTVRWNRLSISPFIDHEGHILQLYGILQDVSHEHQMVEQYNKYISHLSGGFHVCYLSRPVHLEYASDDFCSFLGYSRDEFEQLVSGKYTNIIAEEDRAAFEGYAKRLAAAPGIESCEYRIRRKDGSLVKVIDTMESVSDGSGVMYGYAYVLCKSELHAMLEMAEEKEKSHLAVIDRQYDVLESLGKDYLNVFRVSLDEDKAQIIKLDGYVTKGMNRESADELPYYRLCRQYVQDRVHPDDREKMLKAMHPDTVRKAFETDDDYIVVYRAVDQGEPHFYQLKYVRLNTQDSGDKISFVAGFKNVDRVIRDEHRQKEELQNRLNIINAILRAFSCGYYYDFRNDTFTELSNSDVWMSELIGKSGNFTENRKRMSHLFPDKEAFRKIDKFIDPATISARLKGRRFVSSQVYIRERGWYELYAFAVDYDEPGNMAHVILAARNVTEEKKQEEEYVRSLSVANNRERAAMQAAYTDALTGVMNRNAYERDIRVLGDYARVGIVYCDVNGLRETNNIKGHKEGDRLLKKFAELLRKYFSVDCIYRIGGDEFVCIIGNIGRVKFLDRVRDFTGAVAEHKDIAAVGASYGDPLDQETLIRSAENEMYRMKQRQKDIK